MGKVKQADFEATVSEWEFQSSMEKVKNLQVKSTTINSGKYQSPMGKIKIKRLI